MITVDCEEMIPHYFEVVLDGGRNPEVPRATSKGKDKTKLSTKGWVYWQNLLAKMASHQDVVALKQSLLHVLRPNVPILYLARVKMKLAGGGECVRKWRVHGHRT